MIHVIAIVTAKPGMRDLILGAYRDNLPAVLAEEGCIAYEAVVDVAPANASFAQFGPDILVVVERWATLEALQAHGVAPHMKAYVNRVKDWTVSTAVHALQVA